MAPRGACQCLHDGEPLFGSADDVFHVGAEGEGGIEGNPKDFGVLLRREGGVVEGDGRRGAQFSGLGAEQGDC